MGKVLILLLKIKYVFTFNKLEYKLYDYFDIKQKCTSNTGKVILVQCVEDYYYYGIFGKIISSLKKNSNVTVEQYVVRNLTLGAFKSLGRFTSSVLFNNRLRDKKWIKLYSSFCDNVAYRHEGSTAFLFDFVAIFKAYKIFKKISSKQDVLDLCIGNIKVGDLIYDTYLRYYPAPTIDVNNFYLCIVIWQAIRNIKVTKDYFKYKKPYILLTSYSTYIQHGIAVRIALKTNTRVFSFGNYQSFSKELTLNDFYHTANSTNYIDDFIKLDNIKTNLLNAEKEIEKKLAGQIGITNLYMKKSAYETSEMEIPFGVDGSVIVFMHDFYDSPHIYKSMIFVDFLEWINYTLDIFEKYDIPYYLKPHPNQLPESQTVIEQLKIDRPNARFIPTVITNQQLVDNGMKVGISVYGTVAHELIYLGVPAIVCGDNPHSSYNFCLEAKSKEEYENFIKSYAFLTVKDEDKEEVKSFFYMHNLNHTEDELALLVNANYFRQISNISDLKLKYRLFLKSLLKIGYSKSFQELIWRMI